MKILKEESLYIRLIVRSRDGLRTFDVGGLWYTFFFFLT
jgi:hypothetical protein